MTMTSVEWRFRRGAVDAAELTEATRAVIGELADPDSTAATAARAAGLDPAVLARAAVRVREGEHGLEPIATTIIVGIAVKAGSAAVEALWRVVIWPRLRARLGSDAVGDPLPARPDDPAVPAGTAPPGM